MKNYAGFFGDSPSAGVNQIYAQAIKSVQPIKERHSAKDCAAPIVNPVPCDSDSGDVPIKKLTPIQTEIVRGIASGLTVKQLAENRNCSNKTVAYHLCKIYKRLGFSTVSLITLWAESERLIKNPFTTPKLDQLSILMG